MTNQQQIVVCRLGQLDYQEAWDLQREVQQQLVRDKRSDQPESLPHVLLLLQHPPVFTLGKSGDRSHLLVDEVQLRTSGATYIEIDRGGDITYHGPGQVVGYPILDLDRFYTDIHRYLRDLEEVVIRTCADFGVVAGRLQDRTGVWVRAGTQNEAKICALGIRCSRWVTMHGFALNVNTNLEHFSMIVPCGISDCDVTSLERETGEHVPESKVESALVHHFMCVFGATATEWASMDAESFLHAYLALHHHSDFQQ